MENQIKNLLLDYAAHLSINCEFINFTAPRSYPTHKRAQERGTYKNYTLNHRWKGNLYKQKHIANCLSNILLLMDKLLKNKAKLLVINGTMNGTQSKFKVALNDKLLGCYPSRAFRRPTLVPRLGRKVKALQANQNLKANVPHLLQGNWIHGACSNWSRLCKVAWNSHKLMELTRTLDRAMGIEGWVLEAESLFRGLQVTRYPAQPLKDKNNLLLAYRHKPDCVFLINPSPATVKECKALNVPLCILSSSLSFKIAGSYLESNQGSPFLSYLILNVLKGHNTT